MRIAREDRRKQFLPVAFALGGVVVDVVGEWQAARARHVPLGFGNIAQGDGPAFGFVAVEQRRTGPALGRGLQFPRKVQCIADAGVHAEATGIGELVRSVPGEKHAPHPVAIRNQVTSRPDHDEIGRAHV